MSMGNFLNVTRDGVTLVHILYNKKRILLYNIMYQWVKKAKI